MEQVCVFYTLLRIKWYLDDIRIKGLALPPEDEIKNYRNDKQYSVSCFCLLFFSLASWVFWLMAAFSVPDHMKAGYCFLAAGIIAGMIANCSLKKMKNNCLCSILLPDVLYLLLIGTTIISNEPVDKIACLIMAILLVFADAAVHKSFTIAYPRKKQEIKAGTA